MSTTHIIDISHWQTDVDFEAIRKAGVVGVIHKATEGKTYVDPDYVPRMAFALDAGLLWGAYHFLKHGSITEQMQHFVKVAALPPGSRGCLDHEDPAVSLDELHEAVAVLQDLDPSMQICIYSGHLIKEQLGSKHDPILTKTSLWLAQYTSGTPSWPKGTWPAWSLWQFTDTGHCPGVSGNCDLNEFNGTKQNCALWLGPVSETPPEPVPPAPEPVPMPVQLTVAPGTVVIINGKKIVAD